MVNSRQAWETKPSNSLTFYRLLFIVELPQDGVLLSLSFKSLFLVSII